MNALSLSKLSARLISRAGVVLMFCGLMLSHLHAADLPKAGPVILYGSEKPQKITDEKGQSVVKPPAYFSIFLGNYFSLPDANAAASARTFANNNVLRTSEQIYKSAGAGFSEAGFTPGFEPALRLEWEIPFSRVAFLPSWNSFAALLSFEGGFTPSQNILTSAGPFRFTNDQAVATELKDLTYTGTLTVSEKRQNFTPMVGFQVALQSAGMQRSADLKVLIRAGGGVSLQNGQRSYELSLNPQYISTASNAAYSDNYVIKSSMNQAYTTAILAAGRAELGVRVRIAQRTHLSLIGSVTMLYGILPFDTTGTFAEQGGQKTIYQKVVTGISDEDSLRIMPGIFLALSVEL